MHPVRKKRLWLILAIVVISSAAVGSILYALSDNVNYFFPPSDIVEGKAPVKKRIRVGGMVKIDSVKRGEDSLQTKFVLTDFKHDLQVSYEGILPDLFEENQGAVAAGYLQADGSFVADEVLAKHDENYMPAEVENSLHKQNDDAPKKQDKKAYQYKKAGYQKAESGQ